MATLIFKLKSVLTDVVNQLNSITEGSVAAVTNASTAPPQSGTYAIGDFTRNSAPVVTGSTGQKYIVTGWVCITEGSPGVWVECRSLTGG